MMSGFMGEILVIGGRYEFLNPGTLMARRLAAISNPQENPYTPVSNRLTAPTNLLGVG
jgi:hypothetical protein